MPQADIPVLARSKDGLRFDVSPVVVDDPHLARRLGDRFSWFEGDRGLGRLIEAFQLRRVSQLASVEPLPGDVLPQASQELTKRLENAVPFFLALVEAEAPSELQSARGRLNRFLVSVVEHLTLRVSIRSEVPDELMVSEDAFLKRSRAGGIGAIRFAEATYYCAESAVNNPYRLGAAVAEFLERPSLEDAFAIVLLRTSREERARYLTSKGVELDRVRAMRELLGRTEEPDTSDARWSTLQLLRPRKPQDPRRAVLRLRARAAVEVARY
jgi:hypothetical protein